MVKEIAKGGTWIGAQVRHLSVYPSFFKFIKTKAMALE